jgi:MBG domain (YGX type)
VNDGNGGANYLVTFVTDSTGVINQRSITVSADAGQTKLYGNADPAFTYSITAGSLVGGDTLAGALARAAGENVGAYAINQGTLADANYAISFAGNNFGVTPAPLAIRADDKSKLVGTPLPPFSATYTGFAFGETPASLGGALVYGTPATPGSAPGAYPITPSGQTSTNYTITFVDGVLTVSAGAPVASAAALLYRDTLVAIQGNLDTPVEIQGNRVTASLPVEYSDLVTIEDGGMRLPAGLKP